MLSVLALKMIHTEEYDTFDYIYQVNANIFWKEVKESELPFHRWYKWLEDKFNDLRDLEMDRKSSHENIPGIAKGMSRSLTITEDLKNDQIIVAPEKKKTPKGKGILSRFFGKKDKKDLSKDDNF